MIVRFLLLLVVALPVVSVQATPTPTNLPEIKMEFVRTSVPVDPTTIAFRSDWQPVNTPEFNAGFSTDQFYFRVHLNNRGEAFHGVLELPFRRLERVDLIQIDAGRVTQAANGARVAALNRPVKGTHLAFPLLLKPGETRDVYLHVHSLTTIKVQPLARLQEEFEYSSSEDLLYSGIFSGLLIILIVYNLILFWAFRRRLYLAYILTNVGALVYYLSFDGILSMFVFPNQPEIAHALLSPAGIWYSGTYLIFVAWFTDLAKSSSRIYRPFFAYSLLLVLIGVLGHWVIGPGAMNRIVMVISLTAIVLSLVPLLLHSEKATVDYRWFQLGAVLLLIFATVFMAYLFGLLRENLFTRNALRLGTLLELLFFSMALAMRIRSIDRERQDAEVRAIARTQFAATVSHEIRTPLSAIIGLSELLQETNLDVQQKKYVTSLESATTVLHALANDVLTFSKLDANKVRLQEIAFSPLELVQQTMDVYRFKAEEKKINLTFEANLSADLKLLGDPGKIGQILNNLTSNALKFTPENGKVQIQVSAVSASNKYAFVLSVIDSGIGIAEDKQQKLFQAYMQAEANTESLYGGTGLGLNISQRLARMMHGKLECESQPGKGSKFTCTLLLTPAPEIQIKEQVDYGRIIRSIPEPLKILHIDDSPEMRMLFQFYFAHTRHQVDSAETAEEGVELFKHHEYDFVFSDLHMPGIGGLRGIGQMREIQGLRAKKSHFILLSGSLVDDELAQNDIRILHKPIRTRDIYAQIAELGGFHD